MLITIALILWAAFHSLLAADQTKQFLASVFGNGVQRVYRFGYNLISVVTFLPVLFILGRYPGDILYQIPWPLSMFFTIGQFVAAILIVIGLLQTDPWGFAGLRQLSSGTESRGAFQSRGLYQYVRHPLYSGGLLFIWLTPIMTTTTLVFVIISSLYLYIGSIFEERRLVREFGDTYRAYQEQVPRLFPRVFQRSE
jgi:protein-S-isoprenylcysteine O-methyltransferase Ste14